MDGKQASARSSSGIPRLSRLPLPKPTPTPTPATVRPSPSREGLNSGLRNPRLRPAASREQLGPVVAPKQPVSSRIASKPPTREIQPPSSRKSELRVSPAALRTSRSVTRLKQKEPSFNKPPTPPEEPETTALSRSTSLSRRSSALHTLTPEFEPAVPDLPPLPSATSPPPATDDAASHDLPGFDTPKAKSLKPRPSLSERTIETLQQLQSSPTLSKKTSSFFDPEGTMRPRSRAGSGHSRPGSSYASDGSVRPTSRDSRPGSSSAADENPFANIQQAATSPRLPPASVERTPSRRVSSIRSLRPPAIKATPQPSPSGLPSATGIPLAQTPSPTRTTGIMPPPKTGATAIASPSLKTRASATGLYKKPSLSSMSRASPAAAVLSPPRKLMPAKSYGSLRKPTPSKIGSPAPAASTEADEESVARKSSNALREQIAKARAAKRAADRQAAEAASAPAPEPTSEAPSNQTDPPIVPDDSGFNFGIAVTTDTLDANDPFNTSDPFNTKRSDVSQQKVIQQRLAAARNSGRLNIAAMGLKEIPAEVLKMYDMESMGTYDGSWAETVDLTRFVAADNELETIDDAIFPDVTAEEMAQDEDSNGNIFGGLEAMDLHGNALISLPMGLRQLPLLTSLNLSQNRLANNCLQVITQVKALRDLKLANNLLYGPLDPTFANLENLEIFDLHGNKVSALPPVIENLSRLRILNLGENSFEALPFTSLAKLPLTELLMKKNKLTGTLIQDGVETLPNLQMLDISCNQLTRLVPSGSTISLPSVHQLVLSMNRLQELPDVTSWTSLMTLAADGNAIPEFPIGFTGLTKLRHADFSANDIRVVPPEISRMDNLTLIRLAGNPLRDKKFVSATTEELKDVLAARLEPPEPFQEVDAVIIPDDAPSNTLAEPHEIHPAAKPAPAETTARDIAQSDEDSFATPPSSSPTSPASTRSRTLANETWPVKQGLLDRSNTKSSSLHPVICSKVAAENKVIEVQLHHNLLTCFPNSLSFFADSLAALSLAHNQLVGESYLTEELDLPVLRELNLVSNHITSLSPLTTHLHAPQLEKMDVSLNRITALPPNLRAVFPRLVVLLAANNHLIDLDPVTIQGMEVVDAGNNDIAHLNPKLGLLGGSGGLKRLEVSGNRFRVPRYNVLERGTEATLRWLRGRVPVAEMASWKEGQGDPDDASDTSLADVD
ncbi:leucine Rich Repeat family protein [Colletotrichum graminicola]|uniref:Leucine Rich Repeat family protein n=1 Tax=Colletotrichum graminicola (strain M1.001 / M2 / FGSC 10212) TaxID=645133 RepID=E3QU53_COLGM|nr:leucine Rich Repeat family protein [Colletotrichum graminicola M1.001]EFQ34391.1 leucine Rich Repeat family protein [Colletotrichum graminicola M1.001]WDK22556.1 leucine Rich Repeat family protein [Colletotrichum graminicola]